MKKKNEKVTSNDVLDALSIRLNDLLKTGKKGSVERKNSSIEQNFSLGNSNIMLLIFWRRII